ncbi:MAG: hypothetical protein PHW82_05015 [Bacteroidales bacterium]|nr:hypothetical protein [Bacteroidales bacterium]
MTSKFSKTILGLIIISVGFWTYCTDNYENHALALRNNTLDSIQLVRHYSGSIQVRTIMIASGEYGKFYETSSELWLTPSIELEKICDSLVITGLKDSIPFRIMFSSDKTNNYCKTPFGSNTTWDTEIIVNEEPKFIGKTLEKYYIHIFDINSSCISTNK